MIRELIERVITGPAPNLAREERLLGEVVGRFDQLRPRSTSDDLATRRAENLARIEQKLALQRALGMALLSGTPASQINPVDYVDNFLNPVSEQSA